MRCQSRSKVTLMRPPRRKWSPHHLVNTVLSRSASVRVGATIGDSTQHELGHIPALLSTLEAWRPGTFTSLWFQQRVLCR